MLNFAKLPVSKSSFADALRRKDFAIIFDWFSNYFFGGAIVAFILIAISAHNSPGQNAGRILGLSFIFGCACTVCGWVLGLLFGIPRTLARPQAPATAQPADRDAGPAASTTAPSPVQSRVNTNLEDVSDWLTKTLVGVGLTQLYFVPHYLWQSADKINKAGFKWDGSGQLLVLALFLYFAPGGFWLGYIGTRTILTKLFDSLETPSVDAVDTALEPDALKLDLDGKISPTNDAAVRNADAKLLSFPITALTTPRELGAWGVAKARANDLESAAVALQQASKAAPFDLTIKDALAKIFTAQNKTVAATQVLQGGQDSEVALLNALYEESPAGFTKAITIGTRLAQAPGSEKNLNLHIWLACAYGQQHKFAAGDTNLAESARKKVVEEVTIALGIDAAKARPWLLALWRPMDGSPEDDLASIPKDDKDLTRLLLATDPAPAPPPTPPTPKPD